MDDVVTAIGDADLTHKIEVRMYSRDMRGVTELFFVDHDGHERVIAQWRNHGNNGNAGIATANIDMAQEVKKSSHQKSAHLENRDAYSAALAPLPMGETSPGWVGRLLDAAAAAERKLDTMETEETWTPPPQSSAPTPPKLPPAPMFGAPLEVPLDDTARRRAAKARIRTLVATLSRNTHDQQMRYELALQARNKNQRALEMFEPESIAAQMSIQDLVERVITDRHARERRMMQVYAIQARVLPELDKAGGERIAELEAQAAMEINGAEA